MTEKYYHFAKKFAAGDSIYISYGCTVKKFGPPAFEYMIEGNALCLLTFVDCIPHIRQEVCDALNADTTFLSEG